MSQELTDRWGPKVIGWSVDKMYCEEHGATGLGLTVYVLLPDDRVHEFWWCSIEKLYDAIVDK